MTVIYNCTFYDYKITFINYKYETIYGNIIFRKSEN